MGCDWLAVIIPRLTSLTLRDAFQQYLFTPLGIAPDTLDSFRTAAMDAHRGAIAMRDPSSHAFGPLPMPFDTPQYEGVPPEGKNPLTSAPLWGTLPAFTTILQSLLAEEGPKDKEGRPLLSETMWAEARKDALEYIGAEVLQRPVTKTVMPHTAMEVDWWKKPKQIKEGSRHPVGWSLLQATVLKEEVSRSLAVLQQRFEADLPPRYSLRPVYYPEPSRGPASPIREPPPSGQAAWRRVPRRC